MQIPKLFKVTHWGIATVVVLNAFILESGEPPHRYLGYTALGLVLVRGVFSFKYKTEFVFSFSELKRFIKSLFRMSPLDYEPKRNPLASYVYVFIWLCVVCLALSGWLMGLDAFWGDETLEEIHEIISNILLALVAMHLFGMLTDFIFHKRKPWKKMLKG